jgi:SWI/SNF-related matrix-associated actin-dependent regulator 1 of chromatin subfamily A
LGGIATISLVPGRLRIRDGKQVQELDNYSVNVRVSFNPFARLSNRVKWKQSTKLIRNIVSVEYTRDEHATCISVSAEDKLYIVNDHICTHNTIQAIGTIMTLDAFPCIIVAPKSLLYNWRNEWRKFTKFEPIVYHNSKENIQSLLRFSEVIITNYEGVKKILPYKSLFESIVIDESHYVKSDKTQRYQHIFELATGKRVRCLLTGTPIMNRPVELVPQLKLLDLPKDKKTEAKFKSRYCGKGDKGGENLEELNIKLRSTCMIRREKADVLTDLPDFTRNFIDVEITTMAEYKMAENEFVTYLKEVKQFSDRKIRASMNAEILVKMGLLKQISARGKIEAVKEFIETCFEEEQKVILFAHHKAILEEYSSLFTGTSTITGQTKVEDRQSIVDRFQNNKDERLICLSIRAASVGLTLTAASIELFCEFDWNPAIHDQAEARAHRIGQKDHVNAYYFKGTGTIDEDIISLINYKRDLINRATGTTTKVTEQATIIKDLLKKRYNYDMELEEETAIGTAGE